MHHKIEGQVLGIKSHVEFTARVSPEAHVLSESEVINEN